MAISLTKDLETGIALIDEQHQELINRINSLGASNSFTQTETKKTIDLLSEYVIKHFTDEQELHQKYNYPNAEAHKTLHKNFMNEFEKVKNDFFAKEFDFRVSLELTKFIVDWIIKHIKAADVEFGKYYKEHCSGK